MKPASKELDRCVDSCIACYRRCMQTAMGHCLEAGGRHVEPTHFRLMMACAELCRTAAHVMLAGVENHKAVCGACAVLCRDCARSCEGLDGMEDCARTCKECADLCDKMAA
jgi:hypothetical protein